MWRRNFSMVFIVYHLLITNKSYGYAADERIGWDCSVPVALLDRSIWVVQPVMTEEYKQEVIQRLKSYFRWPSSLVDVALLDWLISFDHAAMTEEYKQEVIERLKSYFRWPSSFAVIVSNPVTSAEAGEGVFVGGHDIGTGGVVEIGGAVPIRSYVPLIGSAKASGTVIIAGKCVSASDSSSWFDQTSTPGPQASPSITSPIAQILSTPQFIPAPIQEVPSIPDPTPIPTITLPPVVIPTIVVPVYVLPELVVPASKFHEIVSESGNVFVITRDVYITGFSYIDGSIPMLGEINFSGYVPAKGTVTICSQF